MAIDNNHITKLGELKRLIDGLWEKIKSTFSAIGHTHTKSDVTDFPTNVSAFTNDAGYLTEETEPAYTSSPASGITSTDISNWNQAASTTELFWCTYGETSYSDIMTAIQGGKVPSINYNGNVFVGCRLDVPGGQYESKAYYEFTSTIDQYFVQLKVDSDSEWSQEAFQTVKNDGTNANGTWGIDITGNASTADNASGSTFTVKDTGKKNYLMVSNGTQAVSLSVEANGSRRGIVFNASGTGAGVMALEADVNNKINLYGNATTASNAQNSVFEVKQEAKECLFRASNGTQTVSLDVKADGSKRGVWCNASGTGSSVWALQIDKNNVVTLNGTATNATSASSAVKAAQDGQGNVIANTYQKLQPIAIGASGVANAAYIAPPIICARDGSSITATTISGIVNSCCSLAYRANKGRQYIILNTSSSSVTITGFANSKSWALTAGTFMTCVYWGGSYYREDN